MPDDAVPHESRPAPEAQAGRAFADLAHEVRSLTAGAQMSAEIIVLAKDDQDRERSVALMKSSLRRVFRLADDLSDVAAVLAARAPGERVLHDLVPAARRACDRLAGDAEARKIPIELEAAGLSSHVVRGEPESWDRTLERVIEAGLQRAAGRQPFRVSLEAGPSGVELAVPCGTLELPAESPILPAWAAPRPAGIAFARGLWLARAFLVAEGGGLAVREARLVATLPAAAPTGG